MKLSDRLVENTSHNIVFRGCWKSSADEFFTVRKEKLSVCSWTMRFCLACGSYPLMVLHVELDTIKNLLNLDV